MHIGNLFNNIPNQFINHKFRNLCFNSKNCKQGDIFFSIKGTKKNGNQFILEAIKNGARTIISDRNYQGIKGNILYLKNKNIRKLLSNASSKFYSKKPKNIIGVTGTNGKSSIANFYFQILSQNKIKVASIGTLGIRTISSNKKIENTTLDPINLHKNLQMLKEKRIENVILEASSHGLKQSRLDSIKFNTAIFTNLTRDHLDYHKTYQDYLNSKLILFKNLLKKKSKIIFDNEKPVSKILKKICLSKKLKSLTIGGKNSNLEVIKHSYLGTFQKVDLLYKQKNYTIIVNLIGKIQIKNILMSCLAAANSNIKFSKIINSINKIKAVDGRLEKIGNLKNNGKVILDYAHTPDALKTCLENVKDQFNLNKISIVFGCGGDRDKQKRPMMGKIANSFCSKIYLTDDNPRGENPKKIRDQIKKNINKKKIVEIPSRKKAIAKAIEELSSGDILLIAGKGHETYQEYNLLKKKFSDRKIIISEIKKKNKRLFKDWKINILNKNCDLSKINKNLLTNNISINSNEIKKKDIFFAIKGPNKDGNNYSDDAIKKKAAFCVVSKINKKNNKKIKVINTLKVLTKSAEDVRKVSKAKFISITGSSGKTSLKELLAYSLNKLSPTSFSKYSHNNKYGVPLSVVNIKKNHDFGVFEVGMDKVGEIDSLTKIIKPDLGVITNISYAHIENFKNLSKIASAKAEIMNNIVPGGTIVLNKDDSHFRFLENIALKKKLKVISFSKNKSSSNIYIKKIVNYKSKIKLILKVNNIVSVFIINKHLKSYIENILASVAVISEYFNFEKIDEKLFFNFKIPNARGNLCKVKLKNKSIYLTDESYNSNPLSLKFAIQNFDNYKIKKRKILLLGDMMELGKFSKKLHKNASQVINKSKINKVYVFGKDIRETFYGISRSKRGKILTNKKEIYELIKSDLNNNDHLMIKGSNSTGLHYITSNIKKGKIYAL